MRLDEAVLEGKESDYEAGIYPINGNFFSRGRPLLSAGSDGADLSKNSNEFAFENGQRVDIERLGASRMPDASYAEAHKSLPVACHDVAIEYDKGILLVNRDIHPAKNVLWVIGGRISRGMPTEDSLKMKAKAECGLDLEDVTSLGWGRTFFATAPVDHGKGTDTLNVLYFARGKGELKLNNEHSRPNIVRPKDYTPEFKATLHPYMQLMLDRAMGLVSSLDSVVYEHRPIDHEDKRRVLITPFNNDFRASQNKIIVVKEDAELGGKRGHYHADYREVHFVLDGQAVFTLEDTSTKERATYVLGKHDRLIIPPRIAHRVSVTAGTILVSSTEKPYVSAEKNDIPYDIP